jgi:hypothetical protein
MGSGESFLDFRGVAGQNLASVSTWFVPRRVPLNTGLFGLFYLDNSIKVPGHSRLNLCFEILPFLGV